MIVSRAYCQPHLRIKQYKRLVHGLIGMEIGCQLTTVIGPRLIRNLLSLSYSLLILIFAATTRNFCVVRGMQFIIVIPITNVTTRLVGQQVAYTHDRTMLDIASAD